MYLMLNYIQFFNKLMGILHVVIKSTKIRNSNFLFVKLHTIFISNSNKLTRATITWIKNIQV